MPTSTSEPAVDKILQRFRARAAKLGFDSLGIADPAEAKAAGSRLRSFIKEGRHGAMSWMEETLERRADPQLLWPETRSVLMLGLNYAPNLDPLANLTDPAVGNISVYARNRDYHDILKGRLKEAAGLLASLLGCKVKVFVDTAPVMEKPLAAAAGIGWQGKHTNLVSRDFGSWLFLGAIFTDAPLPFDTPAEDHCGSCRACLDICPTKAFPAPYQLDARRCISYLTIEHPGPIPAEFRRAIGNRIYGCDDCLDACPWNKFAAASREAKLTARPEFVAPRLEDLLRLNDAGFRALFSGSPVKRIGRDRFLRNVLIAVANSGDRSHLKAVETLLADPSALVRGAAVHALCSLAPERVSAHRNSAGKEQDPMVRQEWAAAGERSKTPLA